MSSTRVDHTYTVCSVCGNNHTSCNWYKHKSKEGKWDGKSYRCAKCNLKIRKTWARKIKEKDIKVIKNNIRCCNCDTDIANICRYKYYDDKGCWDRKSYLCNKCYKKMYYSPTSEEIQKYKEEKLNRRKCCVCGETRSSNWHVCRCGKKICSKYICQICYMRDYNNRFIKSNRLIRTGNIEVGSYQYMAAISQAVVAKYLGIEDLNIKTDNFEWYIDMEDIIHGKIDVKSGRLTIAKIYYVWEFGTNRKIDSDTYFCIGFSKGLEYIDAVYIIPNEGWICQLSIITINRNSTRSSKYDQFKVDLVPYNDIYQNWRRFLGDRKFIGIKDIIEWSNLYNEDIK